MSDYAEMLEMLRDGWTETAPLEECEHWRLAHDPPVDGCDCWDEQT